MNNDAYFAGGALAITDATNARIDTTSFLLNAVRDASSAGGAIFINLHNGYSANFTAVTCTENYSTRSGGCLAALCSNPDAVSGRLRLQDFVASSNRAFEGGAISLKYCEDPNFVFFGGVTLDSNLAVHSGGHISLFQSHIRVKRSVGIALSAQGGKAVFGGAIALLSGSSVVTEVGAHVHLSNSSAKSCGGLVYLAAGGSMWNVSGLTGDNNSAPIGGCFCAKAGSVLTFSETELSKCAATIRGGFVYSEAKLFQVDWSTVLFSDLSSADATVGSAISINTTVQNATLDSSGRPLLTQVVDWRNLSSASFSKPVFLLHQLCQLDFVLSGPALASLVFDALSVPFGETFEWHLSICLRSGFASFHFPSARPHGSLTNIDLKSTLSIAPGSSLAILGDYTLSIANGFSWTGGELLLLAPTGYLRVQSGVFPNYIGGSSPSLLANEDVFFFNSRFNISQRPRTAPALAGVISISEDASLELRPPQNAKLQCLTFLNPIDYAPWLKVGTNRIEALQRLSTVSVQPGRCQVATKGEVASAFFILGIQARAQFYGELNLSNSSQFLTSSTSKSEGPSFEFTIYNATQYGRLRDSWASSDDIVFRGSSWKLFAAPGSDFATNFTTYPETKFSFVSLSNLNESETAIFELPASIGIPRLENKMFVADSRRASLLLNPAKKPPPMPPVHHGTPEEEPQVIPTSVFIGIGVGAAALLAAAAGWFFAVKSRRELKRKKLEEASFNKLLLHQLRYGTSSSISSMMEEATNAANEREKLLSSQDLGDDDPGMVPLETTPNNSKSGFIVGYSSSRERVPLDSVPSRPDSARSSQELLPSLGSSTPSLDDGSQSDSSEYTYTYSPGASDDAIPGGSTSLSLSDAWNSPLEGFQDKWIIQWSDLSLDAKLGQGAFGLVWRGRWRKTTNVAIKQTTGLAMDEEVLQSFKKEALLLLNLRPHPNVVMMCVENARL